VGERDKALCCDNRVFETFLLIGWAYEPANIDHTCFVLLERVYVAFLSFQ